MNIIANAEVEIIDLGLIDYQKAWDYQATLFNKILDAKKGNRNLPSDQQTPTSNFLIFCEHPPVFTLGNSGNPNNLLVNGVELEKKGATYIHTNRGGDITFHGPGQLVVYPVMDLENFFTDIHKYMRTLEEAVIKTINRYGIKGDRIEGLTGVWVDHRSAYPKKICAMGVKTSRWVTMHGLALNVNPDLRFFDLIVPCGIQDKGITSIEKETGTIPDMSDVKKQMADHLMEVFAMKHKP
ncbi:MAG: lipoyl(octanoyl) transferase LipB [Cyclobacteriaceae bacterium]|nr:lipoyl(octanoyl) transferase LipB [Cyclobacteriaceae bacterium]